MNEQTIFINTGVRRSKEYLGDGAYVDHDDTQIWVSAERGGRPHEVALGLDELSKLVRYAKRLGFKLD